MKEINDEILAAISAAVAAATPGYKLVVRSLRRIPQSAPVWSTVGRIEILRTNFNS